MTLFSVFKLKQQQAFYVANHENRADRIEKRKNEAYVEHNKGLTSARAFDLSTILCFGPLHVSLTQKEKL